MKMRFLFLLFVLTAFVIFLVVGAGVYHFILNDELSQAACSADIPRIDACLDRGANINGSGMHGMTPLMSACKGGDLATVRHLISKGADVNGHNDSGSVLMWAIESEKADIVRLLLDHGVDVQWKNCLGEDARAFARTKRNQEIVEMMK